MEPKAFMGAIGLALLVGGIGRPAAPGQDEAPALQIHVALDYAPGAPVGRMRNPLPEWTPLAESWRLGGAAWGGRSLQTSARMPGGELLLLADRAEGADVPTEIGFVLAGEDPPSIERKSLVWIPSGPESAIAIVQWTREGQPGCELFLVIEGAELSGTFSVQASYEAHFEIDGRPHTAWFVDGDLDGEIRGARDRWIAGPSDHLGQLRLANPAEELRPVNAAWYLGDHALRLVEARDGTAVIEVGPPSSRSALLAAHWERVQREFEAKLPARSKMLDKQGEDPDRPDAESPAPWAFVVSVDEALELATEAGKPLLVEFTSLSCAWCRLLTYVTHADAEVDGLLRQFFLARLICDLQPAERYQGHGVGAFPSTVLFSEQGKPLARHEGFSAPSKLAAALKEWLELSEG